VKEVAQLLNEMLQEGMIRNLALLESGSVSRQSLNDLASGTVWRLHGNDLRAGS